MGPEEASELAEAGADTEKEATKQPYYAAPSTRRRRAPYYAPSVRRRRAPYYAPAARPRYYAPRPRYYGKGGKGKGCCFAEGAEGEGEEGDNSAEPPEEASELAEAGADTQVEEGGEG